MGGSQTMIYEKITTSVLKLEIVPMRKIHWLIVAALGVTCQFSTADDAIDAKYQKSCKMCHETGLLNAPKVGDKAAWAPRVAQGKDVLLKHAKEGFNNMPAKGTCADCTDDDLKKLIEKMSGAK